jgi:hypothetical protein
MVVKRLVEMLAREAKAKVRTIKAEVFFIPPASLKAETTLAAADTIAVPPSSKSGPHARPSTMVGVSGLPPALRPHAHGQVELCYSSDWTYQISGRRGEFTGVHITPRHHLRRE